MIGENFTQDQIPGFYSTTHFILIPSFIIIALILGIIIGKTSYKKFKVILFLITLYVVIAEIIKIIFNLKDDPTLSDIPMAYCTLFIPAIILTDLEIPFLKKLGYAFLGVGCIVGGIGYILVPNGSIDHYPLYHINSIHSISYHFLMATVGFAVLIKKTFIPNLHNFKWYWLFITFFSIIAVILNNNFDTNALFLKNGQNIKILMEIQTYSQLLYTILAYIAESTLFYFAIYLIYKVFYQINRKRLIQKNIKDPKIQKPVQ